MGIFINDQKFYGNIEQKAGKSIKTDILDLRDGKILMGTTNKVSLEYDGSFLTYGSPTAALKDRKIVAAFSRSASYEPTAGSTLSYLPIYTISKASGGALSYAFSQAYLAIDKAKVQMDGTASVGTSLNLAREDHRHASDTTKVDKIDGKGLSEADFTNSEKTKLSGLDIGSIGYKSYYNAALGFILRTDLQPTFSTMLFIDIQMNGYGTAEATRWIAQSYYYHADNTFLQSRATVIGYASAQPLSIFVNSNGYICVYVPRVGAYTSIQAAVTVGLSDTSSSEFYKVNRIAEILDGVAGTDRKVDFETTKVYSTRNKPTPAEIGAVNKAGDTMTGTLQVNAPLFAYRYGVNVNAPSVIMDKPGVSYFGIGSKGLSNTIRYGGVTQSNAFAWMGSEQTDYKHHFDGELYEHNGANRVYSSANEPTALKLSGTTQAKSAIPSVFRDEGISVSLTARNLYLYTSDTGMADVYDIGSGYYDGLYINAGEGQGGGTGSSLLMFGKGNSKLGFAYASTNTAAKWAAVRKIYHSGDKPTPAEIGAVNKAGDTMTGALNAPHYNNFISNSNEFNFVPSGYSSQVLFNYRTQGTAGSIAAYRFCNGDGANSLANIEAKYVYDSGSRVYSANNRPLPSNLSGDNFKSVDNKSWAINIGTAPTYKGSSPSSGAFAGTGMGISQGFMETSGIWFDGDGITMWSPCDRDALLYYDEDDGITIWRVNSSGIQYNKAGKEAFYQGTALTATTGTFSSKVTAAALDAPSDIRLKKDIKPLRECVSDKLLNLEVKTFKYKADKEQETFVGLIAQDIIKELGEDKNLLVDDSDSEHYKIKESKLVYMLLDLVKKQDARLTELAEEVKALRG